MPEAVHSPRQPAVATNQIPVTFGTLTIHPAFALHFAQHEIWRASGLASGAQWEVFLNGPTCVARRPLVNVRLIHSKSLGIKSIGLLENLTVYSPHHLIEYLHGSRFSFHTSSSSQSETDIPSISSLCSLSLPGHLVHHRPSCL